MRVNGDTGHRLPNISNLSFANVDGESLLIALDLKGIASRQGSACARGRLSRVRSSSDGAYPRAVRGACGSAERIHDSRRNRFADRRCGDRHRLREMIPNENGRFRSVLVWPAKSTRPVADHIANLASGELENPSGGRCKTSGVSTIRLSIGLTRTGSRSKGQGPSCPPTVAAASALTDSS